jgi:hypothetical protein
VIKTCVPVLINDKIAGRIKKASIALLAFSSIGIYLRLADFY